MTQQFEKITRTQDIGELLKIESSIGNDVPSPNASFLSEAFTVEEIINSPRDGPLRAMENH